MLFTQNARTRLRSRSGRNGSGAGSAVNGLYKTDNALANQYYTDNALQNRYGTQGGGTPVTTALRVAEVQGRLPDQRLTSTGRESFGFRVPKYVCRPMYDLCLNLNNFYMDATAGGNVGAETNTGNAVNLTGVSIEAPNGVIVPIYFSGARTKTLANGDFDSLSDQINPASFGYSTFPAGVYWIKGLGNVALSTQFIPSNVNIRSAALTGSQFVHYAAASTSPSSVDATGVFTATGTALTSVSTGFEPILLGHPVTDGFSLSAVGDSIGAGTQDSDANGIGGQAFLQRAMYNYGTNSFPFMNMCVGSARVTLFSGGTKWKSFVKYGKYAIDELGTNAVNDAVALGTIQTQLQTVWAALVTGGASRIYKTELMCNTTSSDSWATLVNQTVVSGWGAGELAEQLNTWVQSRVGNELYSYIRTTGVKDPSNQYKWRVDDLATAQYATTDGLHPNSNGYSYIAWKPREAFIAEETQSVAQVSNISIWLSSADQTTVLDSNGVNAATGGFLGKTATWVNKVSGGFDATQATDLKRPSFTSARQINGRIVQDCDGVNTALSISVTPFNYGSSTMIAVYRPDTTNTATSVMANSGSGAANTRMYMSNQAIDWGNTALARVSPVTTEDIIQVSRINGTGASRRQRLNINSDAGLTGTVNRSSPLAVAYGIAARGAGTGMNLDGAIAEFIFAQKSLVPDEIMYIANLLNATWGTVLLEPAY